MSPERNVTYVSGRSDSFDDCHRGPWGKRIWVFFK